MEGIPAAAPVVGAATVVVVAPAGGRAARGVQVGEAKAAEAGPARREINLAEVEPTHRRRSSSLE